MNFPRVFGAFLAIILLANYNLRAFETDQYNLPPVPLADIGDEVSDYVEENIQQAIAKLNAGIARHEDCLSNSKRGEHCGTTVQEREQLYYLRSDEAVAHEVFKRLGDGIIPFTRSQTWLNSHKFRAKPARYRTSYRRSIYALVPTNYLTISPTVKIYGSSLGTDKIAHIFQQGYGYYQIRRRALEKGESEAAASMLAVRSGITSEKTYFGTLVSGVYSNADLSANYAGMMFYECLTGKIMIGEVERPAMVALKEGSWIFNEAARRQFLRPFISDHLNEALNPSIYLPALRSYVRKVVRKQSCSQWRSSFPGQTKADYDALTRSLTRWNGHDYGFRDSNKFVTIGDTCF